MWGLHARLLAKLVGVSVLAVAAPGGMEATRVSFIELPLEEMVRTGNSLGVPRGCPSRHVEWLDGRCDASWTVEPEGSYYYSPRANKPSPIQPLCEVDPAIIAKLQKLAADLPAHAWDKPQAKFSEKKEELAYDQAVFHFVMERGEFLGPYYIYAYASEVHGWIEPFLRNITRRYNYADEPVPQHEGYLTKSIPRLFLARLWPRQQQNAHRDGGGSSVGPHKIHVPISGEGHSSLAFGTGPGGSFAAYSMPVGFAYEVNNRITHFALNNGDEPRIHLIFEYLPLDLGSNWTDAVVPESRFVVQARRAKEGRNTIPRNPTFYKMAGAEL